jgi:hypothetical protein
MAVIRNLISRAGIDLSNWEKSLKKMEKSLKTTSKKLQSVGKTMSMAVTAPIVGFATMALKSTEDLRLDFAKLETNARAAGISIDEINKHMRDLEGITGETDSNVEALSNVMQAGFRGTQMDDVINSLAGAVIAFPDTLKIEGLADGLQETLATGQAIGPFAEMLERAGFKIDDFNVGLRRASQSGNEHQYIIDTLANTSFPELADAFREENQEQMNAAASSLDYKQKLEDLALTILPFKTALVEKITELFNAYNTLSPAQQEMILQVAGITAAVGPLLILLGKVVGSYKAIGAVLTFLTGPIAATLAAVAGLIAIFVTLYKTNDDFKESIDQLFGDMKENFVILGDLIKELWEKHGEKVMFVLEKIGEFIGKLILGKLQQIVGIFNIITGILTGDWDKAFTGVKQFIDGMFRKVNAVLGLFTDWELSVENIFDWFKKLPGLFTDIKNGLVLVFNNLPALIVNPIIDGFNALIDGFNNLSFEFPDWVPKYGGKSFGVNIPNIPQLAEGGIVMPRPGGVLANIAEAGQPEAVIPLDKLGSMTGNQVINIILDGRIIARYTVPHLGKELHFQSGYRG